MAAKIQPGRTSLSLGKPAVGLGVAFLLALGAIQVFAATATPASPILAIPPVQELTTTGSLSGLTITVDRQRFYNCPNGILTNTCRTPVTSGATVSLVETSLHVAVVPANGDVLLTLYKRAGDGSATPVVSTNANTYPDPVVGDYLGYATPLSCAEISSGVTLSASAISNLGPGRIVDSNTVTLTAQVSPAICP